MATQNIPQIKEPKPDKPAKGSLLKPPSLRRSKSQQSFTTQIRDAFNKYASKALNPLVMKHHHDEGIPFNPLDPIAFRGFNRPHDSDKVEENKDTKLVFIGTGTSGATPHAWCFLQKDGVENKCTTCAASWTWKSRHNFKNRRANTSVIVVKKVPDKDKNGNPKVTENGEVRLKPLTLVIDVGMQWKENALQLFKAHGLSRIHGVLLTHSHSDGMGNVYDPKFRGTDALVAANLGWLRDWTENVERDKFFEAEKKRKGDVDSDGGSKYQLQRQVDIYASTVTREKVRKITPWFISTKASTGSKYVGTYNWVDDLLNESTGDLEFKIEGVKIEGVDVHHGWEDPGTQKRPLLCTSFRIEDDIIYMGDVSDIPAEKRDRFIGNQVKKPKVLVIDCLETRPGDPSSHFHLEKSLETAREIDAVRTYLTGFSHNTSYEALLEVLEGRTIEHFDSPEHKEELESVRDRIKHNKLLKRKNGGKLDVQIAYDGLCVNIRKITKDGKQVLEVRDDILRENIID